MFTLTQLRHLAKELLALAAIELFPGTLLVDGQVDEIGFSYDFLFPEKIVPLFTEKELNHLDDRIHRLIYENLEVKNIEMMRENASAYLEHLKQPLRAEAILKQEKNIVSLLQIEQFSDLCPSINAVCIDRLKAFKLLNFTLLPSGVLRIFGTAFETKEELKEFLKKYKQARKNDPLVIGSKLGYFEIAGKPFDKSGGRSENQTSLLWHSKGEEKIWELISLWRTLHLKKDYTLLIPPEGVSQRDIHKWMIQKKNLKKVASLSLTQGDLATLRVEGQDLFGVLNSSLQFFQEAFKIFPFDTQVLCRAVESSEVSRALRELEIPFREEGLERDGCQKVVFSALDGYGRRIFLSTLEVEKKKDWVHHSLFNSWENWITFCIEQQRSNKFEFKDQ